MQVQQINKVDIMCKIIKKLLIIFVLFIGIFLFIFFFFFGSKTISQNKNLTKEEKQKIAVICNINVSDVECIKSIKLMEQSAVRFYLVEISDNNFLDNNKNIDLHKLDTGFSFFPALKYLPKQGKITYYKSADKVFISTYTSETPELHDFI